jgi:hypothetical protein
MSREIYPENESEGRVPVDVGELTQAVPSASYLLLDPLAPRLPLGAMHWEDFEKLCAQLLKASNADVQQAFRYGRPQQGQGGIDILAIRRSTHKKLVMECKRVRRVSRGDISRWVDRVLARGDLGEIDEFTLGVTTEDIGRNKHLVDEWHEAASRLGRVGVGAQLWDFAQLEERLRVQPTIVAQFFGHDGARRFCAVAVLLEHWPTVYADCKVSSCAGDAGVVLENRSIRLDMFLPEERRPAVSAAFSFARSDLSGISLTVDGATLISWMQWSVHSVPSQEAPFLPALPRASRYLLKAPTARLQLTASEVQDLQWILREAWLRYADATRRLDELWQASRFPRVGAEAFGLCKIERWFWRAILAYAAEHDFSKGESEEYIFDGGAACLKVYVRPAKAGMQPGYHLIAYGHADAGGALYEGGVIVGWQRLPEFGDERVVYSQDRAWDAEYTHAWLMNSLFPAVLAWLRRKEQPEVGPFGKLRGRFRANRPREVRVEEVALSLAKAPFPWTAMQLRDRDDALRVAHGLQSHFTVYQSIAPVEAALRRRILGLVLYLLPEEERDDQSYIRGNLGIHGVSLSTGLQALIAQSAENSLSGSALDFPLRSLIATLDEAGDLTPARLEHVSRELGAVWRRWWEDLVCGVYC